MSQPARSESPSPRGPPAALGRATCRQQRPPLRSASQDPQIPEDRWISRSRPTPQPSWDRPLPGGSAVWRGGTGWRHFHVCPSQRRSFETRVIQAKRERQNPRELDHANSQALPGPAESESPEQGLATCILTASPGDSDPECKIGITR